jgi:hypothetical protein
VLLTRDDPEIGNEYILLLWMSEHEVVFAKEIVETLNFELLEEHAVARLFAGRWYFPDSA